MIGRCSVLASLIVAASVLSPVCAQDSAVGTYCLTGVREVGSCMRLSDGGQFEYFLSYGAYDERSEGTWKRANGDIIVDSLPYDQPPTFSFKRMQKSDTGAFDVVVVSKGDREIAGIDVSVTCDGASKDAGQTMESRFKVDCASAPTAVALGLTMFGLAPQTIDVTGHAGADRAYVFEFDPGDLGKKKFVAHRLQVGADGSLAMLYSDSPIPELTARQFHYARQQ